MVISEEMPEFPTFLGMSIVGGNLFPLGSPYLTPSTRLRLPYRAGSRSRPVKPENSGP